MTPNPIHKVLSSIQAHRVRALLMGGQACVLYGAAEFSRDIDFAILTGPANLSRLNAALADLKAEVIAVPPFELKYLRKGHAIHFRCKVAEAAGLRIDVMTKMRGVDSFSKLWQRRTTLRAEDGTSYQLMSLPDLVKAKKTQRDKDWPMIRRLVEADYFRHREQPKRQQLRLWFPELRTPQLLTELAAVHPKVCHELSKKRPLLRLAASAKEIDLTEALSEEERLEHEADREYWTPLKAELEQLGCVNASGGEDCAGPHFCSMKITQDVREYAATHGLKEEEALTHGLEEKSRESVQKGAEVYAKA